MRPTRFAAPAILFLSCATFGATVLRAQDQQDQTVAGAARQERARKHELQKRARHVYTEEDLKHPHILTSEDRAEIEAQRNACAQTNNCSPAASQNPPASLDADSQTPQIPLGDVARQLQKQKELRALKPKQTEPFHLPFPTPALASPIFPERPAIRPPTQPALHPKTPSRVFRRDPFSAIPIRPGIRRPEVRGPEIRPTIPEHVRPEAHAPVHTPVRKNIRPTVRPKVREDGLAIVRPKIQPDFSKEVRPTLRTHGGVAAPALPRIFSSTATPSILIQPVQRPVPRQPAQPVSSLAPGSFIRPAQPQPVLIRPVVSNRKIVRVQPGDSLWKLAQQNLGRGNRWPELLAVNPDIADPNQIRVGAPLQLPAPASALVSRRARTKTARLIKVRKGDTLWALAKSSLGRSSYWPCLAAANPSLRDPHRIYGGQNLFLPAACSSKPSSSASRLSP